MLCWPTRYELHEMMKLHMLRSRSRVADMESDSSPLCCCEYEDEKGGRNHVLGFLCDCDAFDDVADRLFDGRNVPDERYAQIWSTAEDRIRVPFPRGARKIPSFLFPPFFVIVLLNASKFGLVAFTLSHLVAILAVLFFHRKILRFRPRTKFFAIWALSAFFFLFVYVYEIQIVGIFALPKTVSFFENAFLIGTLVIAGFSLRKIKRPKDVALKGVFCRACDKNVVGRDHHCVWIDACVTEADVGAFCVFLVSLLAALGAFALICLTSVCESEFRFNDLILWPKSCAVLNAHFEGDAELVFAAGIHAVVIAVPIAALLTVTVYTKVCKRKVLY